MNKEFLEKIKQTLEEKRAQLEAELPSVATKKHATDNQAGDNYDAEFPDFGDKLEDNAAEIALYGDQLSVEESLEKQLRDVNKALAKIEKGEYGVCKYCGKEIDEQRLLARPDSSACISCKTKISKQ